MFAAVGVIRILDNIKNNPDVMKMVLRLMDHLEVRRKEDIWSDVTEHLIPFVTSLGYENVGPELL